MSALARLLGNKKCSNCFRIKPVDQFYSRHDKRTGRRDWQARCKRCNKEVAAGWRESRRHLVRAHYNGWYRRKVLSKSARQFNAKVG